MARNRTRTSTNQQAVVTPLFRMVFFTVTALTLILFLAYVGLVLWLKHPDSQQSTLMDFCSMTSAFGFGGIFGLLGGKATEL